MIIIKNTQKRIFINVAELENDAQKILALLKYTDFDIGIWITTNKTIKSYNAQYRKKNKATDILSFPFYPSLKAGERIKAATPEEKNLGDLIISAEYVQKAAKELKTTLEKRIQVLLVHGICHLLGYDHIKDEDYTIMHRKELALLRALRTS